MDDRPPESAGEPRAVRRLILAGVVAFLVAGTVLLALGPRLAPLGPVQPGRAVSEVAVPQADGTFLVTLDVSDRHAWVGFDFAAGRLADPGLADVAVRRHLLRAPAGGALDLGAVALERASVPEAPAWVSDVDVDGVPQNPVLSGWYEYSYWTHVLASRGHVHAVRLRHGGVALLRVESYYCVPEGSGCLTLRYRLE